MKLTFVKMVAHAWDLEATTYVSATLSTLDLSVRNVSEAVKLLF